MEVTGGETRGLAARAVDRAGEAPENFFPLRRHGGAGSTRLGQQASRHGGLGADEARQLFQRAPHPRGPVVGRLASGEQSLGQRLGRRRVGLGEAFGLVGERVVEARPVGAGRTTSSSTATSS